jgi:hypothetical protein
MHWLWKKRPVEFREGVWTRGIHSHRDARSLVPERRGAVAEVNEMETFNRSFMDIGAVHHRRLAVAPRSIGR